MSDSNWTDTASKAWNWLSETVTVDNAVYLGKTVFNEFVSGTNSVGAYFAAPIGYYIDKAADTIAGRDIPLDQNPIAQGIYKQFNQSWGRYFNENPGQVAADTVQGLSNAATSTVGFVGDVGWYIGGDLILHPIYATAHNLVNDEKDHINYMTDKPFGSFTEQLNDWGQIGHYIPEEWKGVKDAFSRLDPRDPDLNHRRVSLYGAQALFEIPVFWKIGTRTLGEGARAFSTVKKSLGAKAVEAVKNADLLDDLAEQAKKMNDAQDNLSILRKSGNASAGQIAKAERKVAKATKSYSDAVDKVRKEIDLGHINKSEIAGEAAKAADEIEALAEKGASAKKIAAAQEKLTAIEVKTEALEGVRAFQEAAEVGPKLSSTTPGFVQRTKNAGNLGLYKGDRWLNPAHSQGAEAVGASISYVMGVSADIENSKEILKTNDETIEARDKALNERSSGGYEEPKRLRDRFGENNGASQESAGDGAVSKYTGSGANRISLEFNLRVTGLKTSLNQPVITVKLTEEEVLALEASLNS